MTPKLRHICGCEICIIPKDIQIYLNRFIPKLVTDLQQNYAPRHTCNSLFRTKIAAHYKGDFFLGGGCLHATIKDVAQCITCLPIKRKNMIHIKCDLGFCDEFPE